MPSDRAHGGGIGRDLGVPSTSPPGCWPLFQVPGTQEKRVSGLGRLVSSWGEEVHVNAVGARRQGGDVGVVLEAE